MEKLFSQSKQTSFAQGFDYSNTRWIIWTFSDHLGSFRQLIKLTGLSSFIW